MRNLIGEDLTQDNDIESRWKEYFAQLLNGDEINEVGEDVRRARIGENERVYMLIVYLCQSKRGCV